MNESDKAENKGMQSFSERVQSKNPIIMAVVGVILSGTISASADLPFPIIIVLSIALGVTVSALWYLIVNPFETIEELWFMFRRIVIGFSIVVFLFVVLFVYYFKFLSI